MMAGALAMGLISGASANTVALKGAEVGVWTQDYDAAVKLAAEKKLPLLLNFTGSDWCGWCKIMDKQVFAPTVWKTYAKKNVVLVTLDFPNNKKLVPKEFVARNEKLKQQFAVRGFPTYVVLKSDGKTKLGQLGAGKEKTPKSFIKEFKMLVRLDPDSIEAFVKANPDKAKDYKAAIAAREAAMKALSDWIQTKPQRNDENMKKFEAFQAKIKASEDALDKFDAKESKGSEG